VDPDKEGSGRAGLRLRRNTRRPPRTGLLSEGFLDRTQIPALSAKRAVTNTHLYGHIVPMKSYRLYKPLSYSIRAIVPERGLNARHDCDTHGLGGPNECLGTRDPTPLG
jgi:hypothetical protein